MQYKMIKYVFHFIKLCNKYNRKYSMNKTIYSKLLEKLWKNHIKKYDLFKTNLKKIIFVTLTEIF